MARRNWAFQVAYLAILTTVTIIFILLSGCSEEINSPLSTEYLEDPSGVFDLAGSDDTSASRGPDDPWDEARFWDVLETREGESLSPGDVTLEYNPADLPPGVQPRVHFPNPTVFQFLVLPQGIALNNRIRVTIDYSKAELDGANEADLQAIGLQGGQEVPLPTDVDMANSMAGFETTSFARYALARE